MIELQSIIPAGEPHNFNNYVYPKDDNMFGYNNRFGYNTIIRPIKTIFGRAEQKFMNRLGTPHWLVCSIIQIPTMGEDFFYIENEELYPLVLMDASYKTKHLFLKNCVINVTSPKKSIGIPPETTDLETEYKYIMNVILPGINSNTNVELENCIIKYHNGD